MKALKVAESRLHEFPARFADLFPRQAALQALVGDEPGYLGLGLRPGKRDGGYPNPSCYLPPGPEKIVAAMLSHTIAAFCIITKFAGAPTPAGPRVKAPRLTGDGAG